MSASFQPNTPTTGKTTIKFEWVANTAKLSEIIENIAQLLHSRGLGPVDGDGLQIPFGQLSNQQKLNIVFDYTTDTLQGLARQSRLTIAEQAARDGVLTTPDEDKFD